MIQILADNPVLLLFVVASLGYLLGTVKYKGNSLGVAAVLFTGLAIGAINPSLQIPEIIFQLGLSIFIYSIGISSGPAFFKSYKKNGFRDIGFILGVLIFSGLLSILVFWLFRFSAAEIAGIYTGSSTNTAALASVIDLISFGGLSEEADILVKESVVGYTYSYPMGILGGMIAIVLFEKFFKIDYAKELDALRDEYPVDQKLVSTAIKVTNTTFINISLRELFKKYRWILSFGRIYRGEDVELASYNSRLQLDDIIMITGSQEETERVTRLLGEQVDSQLSHDRSVFDRRRIFLSNPKVAGRTIASLNLQENYNAIITRIRRGDQDMLAKGNTVLELGDRVRFIAKREELQELSELFGDSYQESSKINLFSFGLGIGLGLILGSIEFALGGVSFKLGLAGGPLVVGILLGSLRRTGPILWTMPYSANITLQQLGLILLLATIGIKSGNAFIESLSSESLLIFVASAIISLATAFCIFFVGYRFMKIPFSLLMGMVSNQPAILDFATNRSKNTLPNFGYAMMFPIALIGKILIAQLLFLLLS